MPFVKLFPKSGGLWTSRRIFRKPPAETGASHGEAGKEVRETDERYQKREAALKDAMQRRVRLEDTINLSDRSLVLKILETTMDTDILYYFGRVKEGLCRAAVATNLNAPKDLLAELAEDEDTTYVMSAVAANPNTPPEVIERLLADWRWTKKSKDKRDEWEVYNGQRILIGLAQNPNVDSRTLEYMWMSHKWLESYIATNPSTPTWVLEVISEARSEEKDYRDYPYGRRPYPDEWKYMKDKAVYFAKENLAKRGTIFKD